MMPPSFMVAIQDFDLILSRCINGSAWADNALRLPEAAWRAVLLTRFR